MPLPLPNLDTRAWSDLVEEGRALIPRYATGWTDQNVSDPGITLIELLAWMVEQEMYRVNRVPPRHRRKLLALAGVTPRPPRAAEAALTFGGPDSGPTRSIAAGAIATFEGDDGSLIRFRTRAPLTVSAARIVAVQSFDGARYVERTRSWRDGEPFTALGDDALGDDLGDQGASDLGGSTDPSGLGGDPALYLGFDADLSASSPVSLWVRSGAARDGRSERERLDDPRAHHGARIVWEYFDGAWQPLADGVDGVEDDTRALTLDGAVRIAVAAPMQATALGVVAERRFYVRARLAAGRFDAAPMLLGLAVNTVGADQSIPVATTFTVAAGVEPRDGQAPTPGAAAHLWLSLGPDGVVSGLAAGPGLDGPAIEVLAYEPATSDRPGRIELPLAFAGLAEGRPDFETLLPEAPIDRGDVELWTFGPTGAERWTSRDDLDASGPADAHVVVDASDGAVRFGDGRRGKVPTAGAAILARFRSTVGAAGNLPSGRVGHLDGGAEGADGPDGQRTERVEVVVAGPGIGGADREPLATAAGRAAEALWAHERLVELLDRSAETTLDQLGRATVLARAAPTRATTLADYERLALDVPGTVVRRTRAWAGLDPRYPGLRAPGTVAVVVVPELPRRAPRPSRTLLSAVHAYLDRRRVVGTRLVVVGPRYVTVRVNAAVRARAGADLDRVRQEVVARLDGLLDPLAGGPNGCGWPFGRDVYRGEVLQAIDGASGVDHVLTLSMTRGADRAEPGPGGPDEELWGNVCVGPAELVVSGEHAIVVVPA